MLPSSLKRAVPLLAIVAIGLVLFILPKIGVPPEAGTLYDSCQRLAASAPEKALMFAHKWRSSRPDSPAAKHCEALALFATHDYPHAADAFAVLAKEVRTEKPTLAARLFVQEARARQAAGQRDAATAAASSALAIDPGNPEAKSLRDALAREKLPDAPEHK